MKLNPFAYLIPITCGMFDLPGGIIAPLTHTLRRNKVVARADNPRRRKRGLIYVLGGIEGPSFFNSQIVRGLAKGGVRSAIRRFNWNDGIPFVRSAPNLMSTRHQEKMVATIVSEIVEYDREYPGRPISFVAQSGGCWIAIRVIESLPPRVRVSTCVLLAAAISRRREISAAAGRCSNGLISVRSNGDWFYLGVGTVVFGSSDRVHSLCAGFLGFHQLPEGVEEWTWRPAWVRYGYVGNHISSSATNFIANRVAPRIRKGEQHE